MELMSVVLPFIFLHPLIQECQGVLILKKNELSTYSSSAEGADKPFYVNLTCKFMYADYTTSEYLTVTWTDVTNSSNILDVANIVQNRSVNARGEYVNADITRLSTSETDGSIRLEIPDKTAKFKIFDCEVSALSDTPSIFSRAVFAYNTDAANETKAVPFHPAGYIGAVSVLAVLCVVLCVTTVVFFKKSRPV